MLQSLTQVSGESNVDMMVRARVTPCAYLVLCVCVL